MGYSPWGRKESDITERIHFTLFLGDQAAQDYFFSNGFSPAFLDPQHNFAINYFLINLFILIGG